jgi:hypothetical protein
MAGTRADGGTGAGGVAVLVAGAAALDRERGAERRHETLMERAAELGLERVEAEAIYALAEEEGLEPALGLLLAGSGVGVQELDELAETLPEVGQQQAPPDWVAITDVAPEEARRERRLRLSFRRLQALLAASGGSAVEAVHRFLREPDVVEDAY